MDLFTAKNFLIDKAPKRIELLGDKTIRPEPAQHIIEFPGGAIELSRTSDGNYWAHILVNREWADTDQRGAKGALGEIVGSRIMRDDEQHVSKVDRAERIQQIAILIRPVGGRVR